MQDRFIFNSTNSTSSILTWDTNFQTTFCWKSIVTFPPRKQFHPWQQRKMPYIVPHSANTRSRSQSLIITILKYNSVHRLDKVLFFLFKHPKHFITRETIALQDAQNTLVFKRKNEMRDGGVIPTTRYWIDKSTNLKIFIELPNRIDNSS